MSGQGMSLPPDLSAMAAAILASSAPPAVGNASVVGSGNKAARDDHTHTTSVQRATATLDINGEATWTFSTAYPSVPVVNVSPQSNIGLPIILQITAVSTTAVSVKGFRLQQLPNSLVVLTVLQNYNISAGTAPSGTVVHMMAGKATA